MTLTCRSIDRLFLQAYVPKLQSVGQVCGFLNCQRGFKIPLSAAFGQIGEAYVAAIHRRAEAEGVPIRYFAKGESMLVDPLKVADQARVGSGELGCARWDIRTTLTEPARQWVELLEDRFPRGRQPYK